MKIDKKIIEELVGYLKEFNLTEIEYSEGSTKAKVSRAINNPGVMWIFRKIIWGKLVRNLGDHTKKTPECEIC